MNKRTSNSKKNGISISQHQLTVIVFSLFFAWILSFPFEGQLIIALMENFSLDVERIIFSALFSHFLGLFFCGFFVKSTAAAKKVILIVSLICFFGSAAFFFPITGAMMLLIDAMSFAAGLVVASWGFYFKHGTSAGDRIKTAADVLIISNILMIVVNAASVLISPNVGLTLAIIMLAATFILAFRLDDGQPFDDAHRNIAPEKPRCAKPLVFLCVFIIIITINAGLMYQVVVPAFKHFEALSVWYWAVPYIIAIFIMRNLPKKVNRAYILYIAIAMIGFAFLFFMILDRGIVSYLVIDTLLLGACGVFDLFWWSILGEMLDLCSNPARLFGIGLSANVMGVLIGGFIGNLIFSADPYGINPTIIAFIVVFVVLMILPFLNKSLTGVLSDHVYLIRISAMTKQEQTQEFKDVFSRLNLTDRESEIVSLLLKGRTYKMIADELFLSENTVKTHLRNAYSKLGIKNKAELIKLVEHK